MWNLVISTIVFVVAAWWTHRYFDKHEIPKGATRGILVFIIAFVVSWAAGKVVDWVQEKVEGPQAVTQTPDLTQLLKGLQQTQP
jgi:predicted PurR-regulated permease PerM